MCCLPVCKVSDVCFGPNTTLQFTEVLSLGVHFRGYTVHLNNPILSLRCYQIHVEVLTHKSEGECLLSLLAFLIHALRCCALYINLDRRQDRQGCWMLLVFRSFIFSFPLIPRNISSNFGTVHGRESQAKNPSKVSQFFYKMCTEKSSLEAEVAKLARCLQAPEALNITRTKPLHCRTPDEAFGEAEWSIAGTP